MADLFREPDRVYLDWFHAIAQPVWHAHDRQRAKIDTPEAWAERRNYLKAVFIDALGGLPVERTPLNPRVLGTLDRGTHTIERLVFESVPGLWVTANLYVPAKLDGPAPGVLVSSGHWENPRTCDRHLIQCATLARKGYVVLIYDPIGQGERHMYIEDGRWRVGGCTDQHTHLGVQLAASGTNLARFMVWDSMRAIDYLISRPEVDAARIGMTGCSGGGTNTAYTAALDERIVAAMPVCYITTLEERQRSEMIADYEQNLYAQTSRGLDHHEYVAMVAPRAVCLGAAQDDFFPIAGTREAYAAAKRLYGVLGVGEKCAMVEAPGQHGYSQPLRQACYRWFNRWLEVDADDAEPEVDLPADEDVLCFPEDVPPDHTYRAALRDVAPRSEQLAELRARTEALKAELAAQVRFHPELCEAGEWREAGEGWEAAEVSASSAPPLIVARRVGERPSCVAVVPDLAAAAALEPGTGAIVLPVMTEPDLAARSASFGDGKPPWPWSHGTESFLAFYCEILGRDLVYLRAAQVLAGLQALECRDVELTATGAQAVPALYAAALTEAVSILKLVRPLWSYRLLAARDLHVMGPAEVPWAVLGSHDLPDVMAALAPRGLVVERPVGPSGRPLAREEMVDLEAVQAAYAEAGAQDALKVIV